MSLSPTGTPSTLLPNYTLVILLRVIRTPAGRGHAEPVCCAAIQYIIIGRQWALPTELVTRFPSYERPSFSKIQELAGKGRLRATDEGTVLLARNPAPAPYSLQPAGRAACL